MAFVAARMGWTPNQLSIGSGLFALAAVAVDLPPDLARMYEVSGRDLTPAAIGQQVRNLEAALGQQLLVRRANGFEPTQITTSAAAKLASGWM